MRSHKISDRIKTRTKLFLHLRNSSIHGNFPLLLLCNFTVPHFTGKKKEVGVDEDEILIRKEDIRLESEYKVKTALVNFILENTQKYPQPQDQQTPSQ